MSSFNKENDVNTSYAPIGVIWKPLIIVGVSLFFRIISWGIGPHIINKIR